MFPNLSKSKKLLLGSTLVAAASAGFFGCQLDPYIITAEEQYTRNFIKDFGLIDPNQDWNLAKEATVSINLGDGVHKSVKIYAKTQDKYYLVADLTDISGRLDVPVDVPKSTTDFMVVTNGRKYYGGLAAPIDCSDMSRGIPFSSYEDDGTNPNPVVYEASQGDYSIMVQHTDKGNGTDSGYGTAEDGYQYFNTQQMSPIVATTPWEKYYSLNTGGWSKENINGDIGLLPESGKFNREKSVLEKWIEKKRKEGQSIVEDFRISTGDDGKFTLFPYYYGTNLVHELGVYLLGENGDPILKKGSGNKSDYTLEDFVSFPVFQDRAPGDLQVQPYYDSDIEEIKFKFDGSNDTDRYTFTLGEEFDLEKYIYIKKNGKWMSYKNYLEQYGNQTHSRVAYHFWVGEVFDENAPKPVTYATCSKDGIVTPLAITDGKEAYASIGIATELIESPEYKGGKGLIKGVEHNITYFVASPSAVNSPIKTIEISPNYVEIPVGETVELGVTLKDNNGNVLDLGTYLDDLSVTSDWYSSAINIYKDYSDKKIKVEALAPQSGDGEMWPEVRLASNENIKANVQVVIVSNTQTQSHSYTDTYSQVPDDINWQRYFEKVNLEDKVIATNYVLGGWSGRLTFESSLFSGIDKSYCLIISLDVATSLTLKSSWDNGMSFNYEADGTTYTSTDGMTVAAKNLIISLNDDMINKILTKGGLLIINNNSNGIDVTLGIELKAPTDGDDIYVWQANGKAEAKADLEKYYNSNYPGNVNCSCGVTHDFNQGSAEVEIPDEADYDNISYRVTCTYEETISKSKASRRNANKQSRSASSRDSESDSKPSFLNNDGTWKDVNTYWSRYLPANEEVASYPTNMTMLARSRGYDVTIKVDDGHGNKVPYKGSLGMYLKVIGAYELKNNGATESYTTVESEYKQKFPYVVFSQKRFNKAVDGESSDQISALSVKHPVTGRTFLTFEDMRVTHNNVTPDDYWEYSSDRDVNDLIFNITNYGSISNDDPDNEIKEEKNETIEEGFSWLWAVEDLGATDDFDFNDMVMKITSVTKNKTITPAGSDDSSTTETTTTDTDDSSTTVILYKKVTFTPLCAGGTLPLYVHYNDYILRPGVYQEKDLDYVITDAGLKDVAPGDISVLTSSDPDPSSEIHKWFGNYPHTTMINTSGGDMVRAKSCVLYLNTDFTIEGFGSTSTNTSAAGGADGIGGLSVSVNDGRATQMGDITADWKEEGTSWVITPAENGKVSQMFMVHDAKAKWRWPTERTHILDVYPKFKDWVKNMSTYDTWYNKCEDSKKVIERYDLK